MSLRLPLVWLLGMMLAVTGCGWFDGLSSALENPSSEGGDGMDASLGGGDEDAGMPLEGGSDDGGTDANVDMDASVDANMNPVEDAGRDGGEDLPDAIESDPPLPLELTWHPEPRRIAVTDQAADDHVQPRAWLLVHGSDDKPHRLVSHLLDGTEQTWRDTGIWSVDSPPAAVSYTDDSMQQHQRVMFLRDGKLGVLSIDGEVFAPLASYGPSMDYELEPGSIGALWMTDELRGGELIAVVAPASKDGTSGYFCAFEYDFNLSRWGVQCSYGAVMSSTTDIVGVKVGTTPCFFARGASQGLLFISRQPDDTYLGRELEAPEPHTLGASFAVYAGPDPNRAEVLTVTTDGRAWHATVDPEDISAPDWELLPPLPDGATIQLGEAALAAASLEQKDPIEYRVPTVFALGDDGRVYRTSTVPKDEAYTWQKAWTAVPEPARDQRALAIGGLITMVADESDENLHTVARALHVVGGRNATTLQELTETALGWRWLDHARQNAELPLAVVGVASAELSIASGADDALAAFALRGSEPPFSIVLAGSADAASSWHPVAEPLATLPTDGDVPASALAPLTAYGDGRLHLAALEWDLPADCSEPSTRAQRIVYRRAESARKLAALGEGDLDLFVVASSPSASYGAPAFAVTESEAGPTAHVLFDDHEAGVVRHWQLPPDERSAPPPVAIDEQSLPVGRLELVVSAYDRSVYAVTAHSDRMQICNIDGLTSGTPACASPALDALHLHDHEFAFGPEQSEPQGACDPVEGHDFKCFADDKPFSIATSHSVANKLFVAYTGDDGDYASIYLTVSAGGSDFGAWSAPVRVHSRNPGDTNHYFDAEITVDGHDAMFVTYSAVSPAPNDSAVQSFRAYRRVEGDPFDVRLLEDEWHATALPYDCVTQRWALGDYRDADTIGGRSLHALRIDASDSLRHETRWLNESLLP